MQTEIKANPGGDEIYVSSGFGMMKRLRDVFNWARCTFQTAFSNSYRDDVYGR